MEIRDDDPVAVSVVLAIRQGNVEDLGALLAEHPGLADARVRNTEGGTRSLLHVVTDWPGYFPNGPENRAPAHRAARTPTWR